MAKRISWGRIIGALGAVAPFAGLGLWAVTAPAPSEVERWAKGPDDCSTDEVLVGGSRLHRKHDGPAGSAPVDRHAALVILSAARCERAGEIDHSELLTVFTTVSHGLAWIADHEPAPRAVHQLIDVWTLASDQRRVGPVLQVAVWTAVGLTVADLLEDELADPSLAARDRSGARLRLKALGAVPLDWDEVAAREERETWSVLWSALGTPSAWRTELPGTVLWVFRSRTLDHPAYDAIREDAAHERARVRAMSNG